MFFLYILQSQKNTRYYVGIAENVEKRLKQHNDGKVKSTSSFKPWVIKKIEAYPNRSEAYKREQFIKSKHSRKIIKKIIHS